MKSKREFLKSVYSSVLANAVINQIGLPFAELIKYADDYRDANNGVSGFIYYVDTHKFALKNRKEIVKLLEYSADEQGINVIEMVQGFNVFKSNIDNDEMKDLYLYLGGAKVEQGSVTNIMAWFALEETINSLINYRDED